MSLRRCITASISADVRWRPATREISSLPSARRRASRWRSHDSSTSGRRSVICGAERTGEVEHDHPPVTRVEHVSLIAIGVEQQLREHHHALPLPRHRHRLARRRSRFRALALRLVHQHIVHPPRERARLPLVLSLDRRRHHRVERQQPRHFPGRDVVAVRVHEAELASAALSVADVLQRGFFVNALERGIVRELPVAEREPQRTRDALADRAGPHHLRALEEGQLLLGRERRLDSTRSGGAQQSQHGHEGYGARRAAGVITPAETWRRTRGFRGATSREETMRLPSTSSRRPSQWPDRWPRRPSPWRRRRHRARG